MVQLKQLDGSHAWNMVKLNDQYYGLDATWLWLEGDQIAESALNRYYLKDTKIDNTEEYSEEDKMFALTHLTFNNPIDTIPNTMSITNIEITTLPTKTTYIQNHENLDLTGGILTIAYNDETTDTISLTNENIHISGFNNAKIGKNTITVEYEGKTTTFDVQIISKQAVGIEVTTLPTKNQYIQNYENLDLAGGILTITYNDKTTDTISLTNENVKVSNFDNTVLGKNTLIVEYNGIKTNFDVEIVSKSVIKIELTTNPVKTRYIQNTETIDLTGGIITVTYNDKTTDTMSLTNEKLHITGFNNSQVGNNTLTIEYEGVKTSFSIEIISNNTEESEKKDKPTKDDTLAVGTLPQTGERTIIFIVSIIGSFILVITLYKKIKKYNNI